MEDVLILKKTNKRRDEGETDRTLSREQQDLHLQQQINKLEKKRKHLLDLGTNMVLLPSFGEKKIKGSYLHL